MRHCCQLECERPATWQVTHHGCPVAHSTFTDSCDEHIGVLAACPEHTDAVQFVIVPLVHSTGPVGFVQAPRGGVSVHKQP